MQYSPYSATMNPYQTIYNNGGAAAYQPTWGYSDLFAHTLGINSTLPLGYTRQQYNEERALAAESMWKSPLLGLGTFAAGTAVSYAVWGSPFQDLANKVGRGAAFQAGFNNMPNASTVFQARRSMWEAQGALRAATAEATAGLSSAADIRAALNTAELRGLRANAASAASAWQAQVQGSALRNTFWGRVGGLSAGYNAFKESAISATAGIFKGIGSGIGSVFETSANTFGGILERQLNAATGNVVSPWLQKTGTSLFEATESGWMATSLRRAGKITSLETRAAELFKLAEGAKTVEEAGTLIARAETLSGRATTLRGGVFGSIKRYAATGARNIGTILKSGNGITGLVSAGGKAVLTGGIGLASGLAAQFLNPVTAAEMYLIDQAVQYGTDIYQNYQTENEIKRNLMAKGSRILQYGFADSARGLQGGFSTSQRDQIVSRIRDMAEVGASRGDLFGLGSNSFFGGHQRYSERLRELKSILNVGTDMGFFDMSRSMDDFEKKFEQTVKTVDKLSKMLKRTKGEIMTVMANVQNTEGLYNMSAINNSVLKKDFAARLSGVDLTTAMQESAAGAQMGRQAGFSAAMGASLMSDSRVLMSNAIRSGDLSREDIFRLGGEQGVLMNLQQGYLNAMGDQVVQAELAMGMVRDPVTGKMKFDDARLRRMASASDAELRQMSRERFAFMNTTSYSRIRHASFRGGKMYDAMRYLRTALSRGEVSQDQYNMAITGAVRQKMLAYHMDETSPQYQESLRLELENLTGDPATAEILAKQMLGGYSGIQTHNNLVVAADRAREAYEKSGIGLWNMGVSMFKADAGRNALLGASAFVGSAGNFYIGATGFGIGSLESIGTAVGGLIANRFDPTSDYAIRSRQRIASAMQRYGYNYEHVTQFLTGNKTDLEIIAGMRPGEFRDKLQYMSSRNLLGGSAEDTAYEKYESGMFSRMNVAARSMTNRDLQGINKWLDYFNDRTGYDRKGGIGGFLNFKYSSAAALREMGLTSADAEALNQARERLINGGTVDLTKMRNVDIEKFGRVFMTALGKSNLSATEKEDLLGRIIVDRNGRTELQNRIERASLEAGNNTVPFNAWYATFGGDSFKNRADREMGNMLYASNLKKYTAGGWFGSRGGAADTAATIGAWTAGGAAIGTAIGGWALGTGTVIGTGIGLVAGTAHAYFTNKNLATELGGELARARGAFGALTADQITEIERAADPSSNMAAVDRAAVLARYRGTITEALGEDSDLLNAYNDIIAKKGIKNSDLLNFVRKAYSGATAEAVQRTHRKIVAELKKDLNKDDDNAADEISYYLVNRLKGKEGAAEGIDNWDDLKKLGASGLITRLLDDTATNERTRAWLNEDLKKQLRAINADLSAKKISAEKAFEKAGSLLAKTKYGDMVEGKYGSGAKGGDGASELNAKAMANFEKGAVILREVITRLGY